MLNNAMEEISVACSEDMRKFAREVIGKSVSLLKQSAPCSFEAVAIGSIARGEATPYSDLEFLFLIEDHTEQSVCFFEMLALTSYFLIGNLSETKLSYMAIKELHGWFDDRGKNGFKIDGLTDGAGNIPTGNSIQHKNHFIVTPKQLSERYKTILDNPNPNEALRGDLTAMLTYTVSIYSHQNEENSMLHEFRNLISEFETNQERKDMNMAMLTTDAKKFEFVPDDNLIEKGFNADVKKEIYRFPLILLLDICIVSGRIGTSSWQSLGVIRRSSDLSTDCYKSLQFLLAVSTYIRLATYLYHDSHDDRISLASRTTITPTSKKSSQRWFLDGNFFASICMIMIPLKNVLSDISFQIQDLKIYRNESDLWWLNITTLYYSGKYAEALSKLKEEYKRLCERPVDLSLHIASLLPHSREGGTLPTHSKYHTLTIISETLFWCGEFKAALQLYQYMTDNDISDERQRMADCYNRLGNHSKAIEILESISEKSSNEYFSLGNVCRSSGRYDEAEASFLQSLQKEYNNTSVDILTDYYGNPLPVDYDDQVDLIGAASPERRLSMITNITPDIIVCILSLGGVYSDKKQYTRAEAYYKKSLQFIYELYGKHAAVKNAADVLFNQGDNYQRMKQYSNADQCYTEALAVCRKLSPDDDTVDIANTLYNQGINYRDAGDNRRARKKFRKALNIYMKLDPQNPLITKIQVVILEIIQG